MLDNVVFGSYYPIKSKVHYMNPISKILCTLLFALMIFICDDFVVMCLIFYFLDQLL